MTLKRTPLYDAHLALGARVVEFGGWEMPVHCSGILEEHHAVRQRAGLFDISHMGKIESRGPGALPFLRHLLTNDPADLSTGQAQYTLLCNHDGGVLDDLILYRLAEEHYLLVVNAANVERDYAWLQSHAAAGTHDDVTLRNISDEVGLLALQGPRAEAILQGLTDVELSGLRYYHCTTGTVVGMEPLIARTGYTGEDGFELMVPVGQAVALWDALLDAGRDQGLAPAGLGARDTLRLEAAMPLYGHELDEETNPLEAGLGRFVRLDRQFVGQRALVAAKEAGLACRLVGFQLVDRGIPRQGYEIRHQDRRVGWVTSGTMSPTLGLPIGMGYVPSELREPGTEIEVVIRGRPARAQVVRRPFYRREER